MRAAFFWSMILLVNLIPLPSQNAVKLACEDDWYPYAADRQGKPQGLSVDIVQEVFKAAGVAVELHLVPFNRGLILTREGLYDGVFNGTLHSSLEEDYQAPVSPITRSVQVVLAPAGSPRFRGPEDFRFRILGITLGYIYPDAILKDPKVNLDESTTDLSNLRKLALRRIDYTIIDRMVGLYLIAENTPELGRLIEVVGTIESVDVHVLFNRSARGSRYRADFDRGMEIIRKDGTYTRIMDSWTAKFRQNSPNP